MVVSIYQVKQTFIRYNRAIFTVFLEGNGKKGNAVTVVSMPTSLV